METQQDIEAYLQDSGANLIIKALLAQLCIYKPQKPVEFMINFLTKFYMEEEGRSNRVVAKKKKFTPGESKKKEDDTPMPDSNDKAAPPQPNPSAYRRIRRGAVSSEPTPDDTSEPVTIIPKDQETTQRISAALQSNILFSHLEEDERQSLCEVMQEKEFKAGDIIIQQGDPQGDYFYIVNEGTCTVEKTENGETKTVMTCEPGSSFGELALIYGYPRAATVKATTDVKLWAIDRVAYRKTIMDKTIKKRQMYESFLEKVPILSSLEKYERLTIADALESEEFKAGDVIVKQGDPGDVFYIIVSGDAEVRKREPGDPEDRRVAELHAQDYFGEIALLTDRPRAASVIAINHLKCVKLDRDRFNRVLGPCEDILRRNLENYNNFMSNQI